MVMGREKGYSDNFNNNPHSVLTQPACAPLVCSSTHENAISNPLLTDALCDRTARAARTGERGQRMNFFCAVPGGRLEDMFDCLRSLLSFLENI